MAIVTGFAGGDPKHSRQVRVLPVQQFTEMTSAGEGGGGDVGVMDNTGTVNWRSEKSGGKGQSKKRSRKKPWRPRGYKSKNHGFAVQDKPPMMKNRRHGGSGLTEKAQGDAHQEKGKRMKGKKMRVKAVESGEFKLWEDGPNFDTEMRQDVVALEGKNAYLTCRVFDRGNKTVSWIRHHDLHILTVGRYTYTADMRYHSIYNGGRDEWTLQIEYVQKRDAGRYECQINTQPVRSFFVQLKVADALPLDQIQKLNDQSDPSSSLRGSNTFISSSSGKVISTNNPYMNKPKATILGDSDVFMDVGSSLNLTCVVSNVNAMLKFIIWNHKNKTIDYDSDKGRLSVVTNTRNMNTPSSSLAISSAKPSDSGKYTCRPSEAETATVTVHIIDGEHHAASIHTSKGSSLGSPFLTQRLSLLLITNMWIHIFK